MGEDSYPKEYDYTLVFGYLMLIHNSNRIIDECTLY